MPVAVIDKVALREPRLLTPWLAPVGPVEVATEHPLARGLDRLYYLGDHVPRDLVAKGRLTPTGTKLIVQPTGQTRGFGSTVGVGTTDKVNTPPYMIPLAYTVAVVFNRAGTGGGSYGRIYQSAASIYSYIAWANTENVWWLSRPVTGGGGYAQYSIAEARATGTEYLLVVSYNPDPGVSVPAVYVATRNTFVRATVTQILAPAGAVTQSGVITIGNRDANDRVFDGTIRLLGFWGRQLSAAEASQLAADPYSLLTPI